MAENSKIEWCDHTFNPWIGCSKVHQGCANCYAEADFDRRRRRAQWGQAGTRVLTSDSNWQKPLKWNRDAEFRSAVGDEIEQNTGTRPLCYSQRPRVFCASLADVFEDWEGPIRDAKGQAVVDPDWQPITLDDVRRRLFRLIDATPHLDWLLLTKRPENVWRMWPNHAAWNGTGVPVDSSQFARKFYRPNVWLGTSISDQASADRQIPELLKCRDLSPVLFVSAEPLLGPVDLTHRLGTLLPSEHSAPHNWCEQGIDWVICGGESGPSARPMHPAWARSLRDQCVNAGVAFHFKQWGEWGAVHHPVGGAADRAINGELDCRYGEWHDDGLFLESCLCGVGHGTVARVGKKAAGRLLDGREWNELPEVQHG